MRRNKKYSRSSQEWTEWLKDEPVPEEVRLQQARARARQQALTLREQRLRRAGLANPVSAVPKAPQSDANISISIQLPEFRFPKLKLPNLTRKQLRLLKIGVPVAVVAVSGAVLAPRLLPEKSSDQQAVMSAVTRQPDYDPVLPNGNKQEANKGKLGYDSAKKVASFPDQIGNVKVTVSQQPLPETFKKDTDAQVKKLAENFSAKEVINTSTPTAYLGTSAKGPQTVIFAKNDLLVFITSDSVIDKELWAEYITRLQ